MAYLVPLQNNFAVFVYFSEPLRDYPISDSKIVCSHKMSIVLLMAAKPATATKGTAAIVAESPHAKRRMTSLGDYSIPFFDILPNFTV